jgi:hypothetical protein
MSALTELWTTWQAAQAKAYALQVTYDQIIQAGGFLPAAGPAWAAAYAAEQASSIAWEEWAAEYQRVNPAPPPGHPPGH